jgi:hypothetical protein
VHEEGGEFLGKLVSLQVGSFNRGEKFSSVMKNLIISVDVE